MARAKRASRTGERRTGSRTRRRARRARAEGTSSWRTPRRRWLCTTRTRSRDRNEGGSVSYISVCPRVRTRTARGARVTPRGAVFLKKSAFFSFFRPCVARSAQNLRAKSTGNRTRVAAPRTSRRAPWPLTRRTRRPSGASSARARRAARDPPRPCVSRAFPRGAALPGARRAWERRWRLTDLEREEWAATTARWTRTCFTSA